MKALLLLLPLALGASTDTIPVDTTPARVRLEEIVKNISKIHEDCVKGGKDKADCDKKKEDELYANGLPKDWFEKGDKEYRDFWAKREASAKK